MPIRPPSLRSIATFEAVARHGSFGKAAAELNLTTSALSHSVKSLEDRINRRLFHRSAKGVTLTEAGISLLARVRLSLGLLSDALDVAPLNRRELLIVSTLPSIARKLIVPNLDQLVRQLPGISIELHATNLLKYGSASTGMVASAIATP